MNRRKFIKKSLLGLTGLAALPFIKSTNNEVHFDGKSDHLKRVNPNDPELFNGSCVAFYFEGKALSDEEIFELYCQTKIFV